MATSKISPQTKDQRRPSVFPAGNFVAPNKLMGTYSIINVVLVLTGVLFPSWYGLWAIFLTSVFMSLMFPTIFALGLKGLGANTKIARDHSW